MIGRSVHAWQLSPQKGGNHCLAIAGVVSESFFFPGKFQRRFQVLVKGGR